MTSEILHLILIFFIFIFLFICTNMYLKKSIEKYGTYCGRYNMNQYYTPTCPNTPNGMQSINCVRAQQAACSKDSQCLWNSTTNSDGTFSTWCGQNPNATNDS